MDGGTNRTTVGSGQRNRHDTVCEPDVCSWVTAGLSFNEPETLNRSRHDLCSADWKQSKAA
jgi:hypothetical protein